MTGPRHTEGMDLFEVYEANGALLLVASYIPDDLAPTDVVYRRPWSTAAAPLIRTAGGGWDKWR